MGCLQSAYFVGKMWNVDIRQHGSGNLGTTNALRVLGKKAGIITFLCDCLKSVIAFVICYNVFGKSHLMGLYGCLGAILGHDFPFYLGFKGGKGIASTIGMGFCMVATISPIYWLSAVTGIGGILIKGYVSMGSLMFIVMLPVLSAVIHAGAEVVIITAFLASLAVYQHRANIKRIIAGNENTLFKKKTK